MRNITKYMCAAMVSSLMLLVSNAFATPSAFDTQTLDENVTAVNKNGLAFNRVYVPVDIAAMSQRFTSQRQIAVAKDTSLSLDNSTWIAQGDGRYLWRLTLVAEGAENLALRVNALSLPEGVVLNLYNSNRQPVFSITAANVESSMQNGTMLTPIASGDTAVIELVASDLGATANTVFATSKVFIGVPNPMRETMEERARETSSRNGKMQHSQFQHVQTRVSPGTYPTSTSSGNNGTLDLPPECEDDFQGTCRRARLRNYGCFIDDVNNEISRATVGLLIDNGDSSDLLTVCSGTLVNTADNSGANYILTTEHCSHTPTSAGQAPDPDTYDANYRPNIVAYWNQTTACGTEERTFFNGFNGPTTTGYSTATAVQEVDHPFLDDEDISVNADGWLLFSSQAIPEGANPYWAGIDARDTASAVTNRDPNRNVVSENIDPSFTLGFNIAHPAGLQQHFASTNEVYVGRDSFVSDFDSASSWVTEMSLDKNFGSVVGGSSGSALVDQNGNVRGALSFVDSSGSTDFFARVDISWRPTINGGQPLEQEAGPLGRGYAAFLDPNDTGVNVISGFEDPARNDNLQVFLNPSAGTDIPAGATIEFSYLLDNAQDCSLAAEPPNPDWAGPLTVQNDIRLTRNVTTNTAGDSAYALTCTNADGFRVRRIATFNGSRGGNFPDEGADGGNGNGGGDNSGGNNSNGGDGNFSGGGGGGGCAMSSAQQPFDPGLLFLVALASLVIARKKETVNT